MTDFETHPVGTADLLKRLRSNTPNMSVGHAAMRHAAARIEQLEAALTRANAATAAAYEVAANVLDDEIDMARIAFPQAVPILAADRKAIRALATPDQTSALDKLIAEAVKPYVEALRALIDHTHECERKLTEALYHADFCGESRPLTDARAILAASKKGGA